MPERGCVVLNQPQQTPHFRRAEQLAPHCGWSSTQPRSFFQTGSKAGKKIVGKKTSGKSSFAIFLS